MILSTRLKKQSCSDLSDKYQPHIKTFIVIIFSSLLLFLLTLPAFSAFPVENYLKTTDKKLVLVLNSYNKDYKWTNNTIKGIEDVFLDDHTVILHNDFMDTKITNDEYHFSLLKALYKNKYQLFNFDAIISTDDDALKFLRQYRSELFGEVPVIFCGVNDFTEKKVEDFSLYTGVNEASDYTASIELILKLHPKLKKLYIINDSLTTGQSIKKGFNLSLQAYQDRFETIYLENISMAQLKQEVSHVEKKNAIFYLSFFRDSNGITYTPREAIPQITSVASTPVYGSADYMLGYGIIGGMLRNSYFQGKIAAQQTKKVLSGINIDKIPIVIKSPNQYMFDYNVVTRYGLSLSDLPKESYLINEPQTFYYKYKFIIFTVLGIFIILLVYIITLLSNIHKRMRAQNGLQAILESATDFIDIHSMQGFQHDIVQKIKKIVPTINNISFYKVDGANELHCIEYNEDCDQVNSKNVNHDFIALKEELINSSSNNSSNSSSSKKKYNIFKNKQSISLLSNNNLPFNLLYAETNKKFDDIDNSLLEMFTSNLSMALDKLDKRKIEESLETAQKIQMSMLPEGFSHFREQYNIDIYAYLSAAKEVGGDLYDFFVKNTNQMFFTVGDVSDKGVPAALFMAVAKTLIHSIADHTNDPAEILFKVNNQLCQNNEESMFVTLFLAVLDLDTGQLRYANAGHTPCYILKEGDSIAQLKANTALPLGAFEDVNYITEQIQLTEKQGILLYSDGVTEAMNLELEMYDEPRLEAILKQYQDKTAQIITHNIINNVQEFVEDAPQSDDITLLLVKRI